MISYAGVSCVCLCVCLDTLESENLDFVSFTNFFSF